MQTLVAYGAAALGPGLRLRSRRERSDRPPALNTRLVLASMALAGLVGFTGSAWRSDMRVDANAMVVQARSVVALAVTRPRLPRVPTQDEQRYADALRSIHTQLELSVARVGLGAAFYKSREIDRRELRTRLSQGLDSYRLAEAQITALQPPPALRAPHREYLTAVRLFEQSALEMLRMYEDGDEEHLSAALPFSLDGTQRLQVIRGQVWPNTYPPG